MSTQARIVSSAIALIAATVLAGCGSGSDEVVARVGDVPITKSAVAHWMTVISGGQTAKQSTSSQTSTLRRQALALLIARQWLVGEAASRGILLRDSEVREWLERLKSVEFPGGAAEQSESLKASGETLADLEQQVRAELALAKLRQNAVEGAPAVTPAQVAAYYVVHKRDFLLPERREARSRNWKHFAEALNTKHEVEAGKSLTSPEQREAGEFFTGARVPPGDPWEQAIDSSKPYVVSGPYQIKADYWLYQVVKVIPPHQRTLAEVSGSIRRRLTDERRQKALADLIATGTARWTARTDCRSGYVVQRCRQYKGPLAAENLLAVP